MFEVELESLILDHINRKPGWFCWKNYSVGIGVNGTYRRKSKFAPNGISDILGIYEGILIAVEVKLPGSKPTPAQQVFIDKINHMGGEATWVDSVDKAKEFLKRVENKYGLVTSKNGK